MGRVDENENRSKITITAESLEEARKVYNGLSLGGQSKCQWKKILMELISQCSEINSELNG
jgi:hypothetical protein